MKECKSLEALDISLCTKLTEASGISIGENCPNLKSFKAGRCPEVVTDNVLLKISNNCLNLHILDISYCRKVTDDGIEGFINNKQKFVVLALNAIENLACLAVIGILRNSATTLERLEMSFMDSVVH